jgi:4'-phosphopantetheinyl transferase
MPLIHEKFLEANGKLAIWHCTEPLNSLQQEISNPNILQSLLSGVSNEKRQIERAAVCLLLERLFQDNPLTSLQYTEHGKPYLPDNDFGISISHSKGYVAVYAAKNAETGIDIELITPRILSVAPKFLNANELEFMNLHSNLHQLYAMWGAKEVVYKIYGQKSLDFKENLILRPFTYGHTGNIQLQLKKDSLSETYNLHYQCMNDIMLVYGKSGK